VKQITVTLTIAEARALSHAVGNTTSAEDAMEAVFSRKTERAAAYRAHAKLDAALASVGGFKLIHKKR
jgi:hypothetical protein